MTVPVVGRRICAVLAVTSAVLHGFMAADQVVGFFVAVAMAAVCLVCARELWVAPTTRTWALVAAMNLVMIALHLPASTEHHHSGALTASHPSTVMALATVIAAVEVVVAAAVLYRRSRGQARLLIPRLTATG